MPRKSKPDKPEPTQALSVKEPDRIVRVEEAAHRLGVHPDTLRNWWMSSTKRGVPANLPPPRQVGPNVIGVLESELERCLMSLPVSALLASTGPEVRA